MLCLLRVTWVLLAWVATPPVAGPLKVSRFGGDWQVLPPVTSTLPSIQSRAARSFEVIFSVLSSRSSRTAHVWIRFVGRSVLCACHKMVDVICADVNELESRDVFDYPVFCGHRERWEGRVSAPPRQPLLEIQFVHLSIAAFPLQTSCEGQWRGQLGQSTQRLAGRHPLSSLLQNRGKVRGKQRIGCMCITPDRNRLPGAVKPFSCAKCDVTWPTETCGQCTMCSVCEQEKPWLVCRRLSSFYWTPKVSQSDESFS